MEVFFISNIVGAFEQKIECLVFLNFLNDVFRKHLRVLNNVLGHFCTLVREQEQPDGEEIEAWTARFSGFIFWRRDIQAFFLDVLLGNLDKIESGAVQFSLVGLVLDEATEGVHVVALEMSEECLADAF